MGNLPLQGERGIGERNGQIGGLIVLQGGVNLGALHSVVPVGTLFVPGISLLTMNGFEYLGWTTTPFMAEGFTAGALGVATLMMTWDPKVTGIVLVSTAGALMGGRAIGGLLANQFP